MKKMSEYAMAYVGVSFKSVDAHYFPLFKIKVIKVVFETALVSSHHSLQFRATFGPLLGASFG